MKHWTRSRGRSERKNRVEKRNKRGIHGAETVYPANTKGCVRWTRDLRSRINHKFLFSPRRRTEPFNSTQLLARSSTVPQISHGISFHPCRIFIFLLLSLGILQNVFFVLRSFFLSVLYLCIYKAAWFFIQTSHIPIYIRVETNLMKVYIQNKNLVQLSSDFYLVYRNWSERRLIVARKSTTTLLHLSSGCCGQPQGNECMSV